MSGLAGAVVAVVVSGLVGGLTEEVCWLAQLTAHIVLTGGGDPLDLNISTICVETRVEWSVCWWWWGQSARPGGWPCTRGWLG